MVKNRIAKRLGVGSRKLIAKDWKLEAIKIKMIQKNIGQFVLSLRIKFRFL
jgi:hypothetical protein